MRYIRYYNNNSLKDQLLKSTIIVITTTGIMYLIVKDSVNTSINGISFRILVGVLNKAASISF